MSQDQEIVTKRPSTFPLFSKNLKLQPLNSIQFSHNMRRHFEDFIDAFRKRIDIELAYSKNLEQVSKQLDKYIKPGTDKAISFISSAFRVQNQQRSHQAKELADSLKTQILDACIEMHKNQTTIVKKMEKDMKKYYKEALNLEQNHSKTLEKYKGINKETEQMIITKNIMKYTTGIPQEKKIKLITKTMEGIKQNKEYQKLYIASVRQYNEFAANYNKQVTLQLDEIQTQIRDQIIFETDCMRKLIVCEVSMFKNIEYDLISISKQMEYVDTQKDVEQFVEQTKGSLQNSIVPLSDQKDKEKEKEKQKDEPIISRISVGSTNSQDSPSNTNQLEEKKIIGKSLLSQSLLYVEEEYFSWMLSCKKSKKLRSMIQNIWRRLNKGKFANGEQKIEEQKETDQEWEALLKKEFLELMSCTKIMENPNINLTSKNNTPLQNEEIFSSLLKITKTISEIWNQESLPIQKVNQAVQFLNTFFVKHHYYRLLAYIFIEQYRIEHEVVFKKPENAKACGKLIKILLEQSLKKDDVFIIRGLLGLMFTFYWVDDKSKKLLYQNKDVYDSQIWKRADLWEAAIFETTYEQMAGFSSQKGQTQAQTILRQKNLVFSQLASYCHYMIMLGITSKNVRLIVGRYCRLYEMSQEQNKDLSKMISNTNKQYKQLVSQVASKGQKFIE